MLIGGTSGVPSTTGIPSTPGSSVDYGRMSGLASGLDTEGIIKSLMQVEKMPLNKLMQQKQIWQWQQDDYRRVNTALVDFRDNSLLTAKLQGTYLSKNVSTSNSSVVTAAAGGTATNSSYSILVSQLAQQATVSSTAVISTDPNFANLKLNQIPSSVWTSPTSTFSLTVNGEAFTFDPAQDTVNTILSKINADTKTGVSAYYDSNAGRVVMQTTATGSGAKIQITDTNNSNLFSGLFKIGPTAAATSGNTFATSTTGLTTGGVVQINGYRFQFAPGQTLTNIESLINAQTGSTGITASDTGGNGSGSLILTGNKLYTPISMDDPANVLGFTADPNAKPAKDAKFSVNGFNTSSASNTAQYNGITLNLTGVSAANQTTTVTVSNNVDGIVKSIESFIDKYNSTLKTMTDLYSEKKDPNYPPLTDDQKAQMTQVQIDQWNAKAQVGMLSTDSLLGSTIDSLRGFSSFVYRNQTQSTLNGQTVTFNSLGSIGISTTSWFDQGQLHYDDAKLRAAVQADPNAVMKLFTDPTNGIATKMYTAVDSAVTQISQQAGMSTDLVDNSSIGLQLKDINTRTTDLNTQIAAKQQAYYTKFTNLEKSISQLNNQSSYLKSMLGQ